VISVCNAENICAGHTMPLSSLSGGDGGQSKWQPKVVLHGGVPVSA